MLRRTALALLALSVLLPPASAGADGDIRIRMVRRGAADSGTAHFTIANHTSDVLAYTTYDGGNLHNGLEHHEGGAWVAAGIGYCGLGMDGEVTVAAGASQRVSAYVGTTPGTYRITVSLERRTAAGTTTTEEVVSDSFQVR